MPGFWAVLMIIWGIFSVVRKAAGKNGAASGQRAVPRPAAEVPRQEGPAMTIDLPTENEDDMIAEDPIEAGPVAPFPGRETPGEGESWTDESGCVGGSMEHVHEDEGVFGEEAAPRTAARRAVRASSARRPRVTAATMRQAVVASEVLGAPVSLRRGRGRSLRQAGV